MEPITLHPNMDRVLQLIAQDNPAQAAAATRCLAQMAGELLRSTTAPDLLWTSSALGRTGFPIECAFVSGDSSVRFTTEVTGPEVPPAQRLTRAETLFTHLNGTPLPAELSHFFHEIQPQGFLKYGAWLGSRHKTSGNTFKLYIEIPCTPDNSPVVKAWEEKIIQRPPRTPPLRPARLRMVGYNGDAHTLELYYDTTCLWPHELPDLMAPMGLQDRAQEVLDTLFQAYRRPVKWELPGSDYGFSYALPYPSTQKNINNKNNPNVFSLYTFANALFGGDHSIRAAILNLAHQQGWTNSLYEEISRPLEHSRGFITHHGVFGIVITPHNPPAVTFGLTPP